ncbi:MAG: polymer-forming cytoskeletal protein [bacterium]|nr:polymer-forming cytoskeletal protein [bacterium]MCP5070893.1 polymer-forming cytoskeletal protein [bacterium]
MSLFGKSQHDSTTDKDKEKEKEAPAPQSVVVAAKTPAERPVPSVSGREHEQFQGGSNVANIGKSITIKGDLTGNEDLQIDGKVDGRIDLPNNQLTIGAEGEVKAEVTAKAVTVIGHVTGNLSATDKIEVEGSGIVDGDVCAPRLIIQEGAVLNGAVEMGHKATAKQTASPSLPKPVASSPAAGASAEG